MFSHRKLLDFSVVQVFGRLAQQLCRLLNCCIALLWINNLLKVKGKAPHIPNEQWV